jgi:hypothetical protein
MAAKKPIRMKPKLKKRQVRQLRAQVAPVSAEEPAGAEWRLFDEPATPARRSVVPVEEPIEPPKRAEEPSVCGEPDASRPEPSDLH